MVHFTHIDNKSKIIEGTPNVRVYFTNKLMD